MVVALVLVVGVATCVTYNGLVTKDQAVTAQWAQVENVYQRRADLVPNLIATVKGAADFEKGTLTAVTDARSRLGQLSGRPEQLQEFQAAQGQLGAALSRLIAVAEAYPTLTATQNFRDLQAQLEGTENRIAVERMRFNDTARAFNTARSTFPTTLIAGMFGSKFEVKQYFAADAGAAQVPKVQF